MLQALVSMCIAAVMWVQVPQWQADWSKCAVDLPDADCHWYVVAPDNTFGEGFDWATAPWFDANGLNDIAQLDHTMTTIHEQASAQRNG
ncbi:MAG: hypothetical protein ACON4T_01295 [Synechococcus sp.]